MWTTMAPWSWIQGAWMQCWVQAGGQDDRSILFNGKAGTMFRPTIFLHDLMSERQGYWWLATPVPGADLALFDKFDLLHSNKPSSIMYWLRCTVLVWPTTFRAYNSALLVHLLRALDRYNNRYNMLPAFVCFDPSLSSLLAWYSWYSLWISCDCFMGNLRLQMTSKVSRKVVLCPSRRFHGGLDNLCKAGAAWTRRPAGDNRTSGWSNMFSYIYIQRYSQVFRRAHQKCCRSDITSCGASFLCSNCLWTCHVHNISF